MSSRILCVNCGLWLKSKCLARYIVLEQDAKVISFIAERISPRIIDESDIICRACLDAVTMRVDQIIQGDIPSNDNLIPGSSPTQVVGHLKVCLTCGRSILRRRSNVILCNNPSELQQMIATSLMNSIQSQKLTRTDRVCCSCWMKARRKAQHILADSTNKVLVDSSSSNMLEAFEVEERESNSGLSPELLSATVKSEMPENVDTDLSPDEADIVKSEPSIPSISSPDWVPAVPSVPSVATENVPAPLTIMLSNYRRAPNTSAKCVFSYCTNQDLNCISDDLRKKIIIDHDFYLPAYVRVCSYHLLSNNWDTLYNSENSTALFTVEQVEHIFSFIDLNKTNSIDYKDPLA